MHNQAAIAEGTAEEEGDVEELTLQWVVEHLSPVSPAVLHTVFGQARTAWHLKKMYVERVCNSPTATLPQQAMHSLPWHAPVQLCCLPWATIQSSLGQGRAY